MFIASYDGGLIKGSVKTRTEVPENLAVDKNGQKMVWGILKSWSDYSKAQRTSTIQNLITEMIAAGVNSRKFSEILQGMQENSMRVAG